MAVARPGQPKWDAKEVLCPLFVAYHDYEIRCHPHVPEAAATILRYKSTKDAQAQKQTFCEGCWNRCEQFLAWKHFRWEEED